MRQNPSFDFGFTGGCWTRTVTLVKPCRFPSLMSASGDMEPLAVVWFRRLVYPFSGKANRGSRSLASTKRRSRRTSRLQQCLASPIRIPQSPTVSLRPQLRFRVACLCHSLARHERVLPGISAQCRCLPASALARSDKRQQAILECNRSQPYMRYH